MFRFKQFVVADERCGMKVGTDGVLLGAWATVIPGALVWDVGAGSGLISLMAMQRGASRAVAFEIDAGACADMRDNVAASAWAEAVEVSEGDFAALSAQRAGSERPDLIVSNPPFFTETLRSPTQLRAKARHADTLDPVAVIRVAAVRLVPGGHLAMIAPMAQLDSLRYDAHVAGLHMTRLTLVRTVERKAPKRFLGEWSLGTGVEPDPDEIVLGRADGSRTDAYARLTGDFYL